MIILHEDGAEQCCLCAHPARLRVNGAWFCVEHREHAHAYLRRAIARLAAACARLPEPAPVPASPPEVTPITYADLHEPAPRPPARRPRPDRSALRSVTDRELRAEVARALDRGWEAWRSNGGHIILRHPITGARAVTSTSTGGSKGRGLKNLRAEIARGERAAR